MNALAKPAVSERELLLTRVFYAPVELVWQAWTQTPHLESDAYATGQVLYTLRQLGVPAADPALQRGAALLLRTQQEDGSWHGQSRAMKIQPYFGVTLVAAICQRRPRRPTPAA